MPKPTAEQTRVLRKLRRSGPKTAEDLGCRVTTLMALNRLGWIWVETTFGAIMYPRRALAWIQDKGRAALRAS